MKRDDLLDLLDAHSRAMIQGEGYEAWTRSQPPLPADVTSLFELAQAVHRTLVPLVVPAGFRAELQETLLYDGIREVPQTDRSYTNIWVGAAAVGSVLSLAGLFFFWRRRRVPLPLEDNLKFSL